MTKKDSRIATAIRLQEGTWMEFKRKLLEDGNKSAQDFFEQKVLEYISKEKEDRQ